MRKKKQPANPVRYLNNILDIQDYLKCNNERDYVLFVLGIATGYRAGDLVKLKVRDVKEALRNGYFYILEEKKEKSKSIKKANLKPREAEVVPNLAKVLRNYIKDKKDYEFMFQSRKGINKHIQVSRVSRILKDAGEYFGLKNISAHSLRKTYAYNIYIESDHNIEAVRELLNHSTAKYTRKYIGLDREQLSKYVNKLNELIR